MTLDEIKKMIANDVVIDDTELDLESLKIPQLHNKYLNLYTDEKLILGKAISDYNILLRKKWEYYTGKLDREELEELGWLPFQHKILKPDIEKYLESDAELIQKQHLKLYQEEKVKYLDAIIKNLNTRHWKIRNAIEWRKFVSGV
tara:strand:- start:493 stop:927 length:435 start_codon:yes stop_codon:yes gene_type:complete